MRSRLNLLAGVTALAMSVGGITAVAAEAEQAYFTVSKPLVAIAGKVTTVQSFESTESSLAVECHTSAESITFPGGEPHFTAYVHAKYSKCTAFGFEGPTLSEGEYTYSAGVKGAGEASVGTVAVDNTTTISVPLAGCTVTITPEGNSKLSSVDYDAAGGVISVERHITGITDTVSEGGTTCGGEGEHTNGTYAGNSDWSSTEAELGIG